VLEYVAPPVTVTHEVESEVTVPETVPVPLFEITRLESVEGDTLLPAVTDGESVDSLRLMVGPLLGKPSHAPAEGAASLVFSPKST